MTPRSRQLRVNATEAEKALWRHLRGKQFGGLKFRRQEPIGPYIVDFVCYARSVVIEVDGGQHADNPDDAVRDQWLCKQPKVR